MRWLRGQCVLDSLIYLHTQSLRPNSASDRRILPAPGWFHVMIDRRLFGGTPWRAHPLPYPLRGRAKREGPVDVALANRDTGQALQNDCDTSRMAQIDESPESLLEKGTGGTLIVLLRGEAAQIGVRSSHTPAVFQTTKNLISVVVEARGLRERPFIEGYVPEMIQRPGDAVPIFERPENGQRFFEKNSREGILTFRGNEFRVVA